MPIAPEALLISSVMRDRDYSTAVSHGVTTEMFRAYAEEWSWIADYVQRHKKLPTKTAFRETFPGFRIKAVNDTEHFVDEVRKAYARRELTRGIKDVAKAIADGQLTEAVELLQSNAVTVGASMSGVRDSNLTDDWQDAYKDVARRVRNFDLHGHAGIPTGWASFDERTGGLNPGQLIIIGARQGEKKSWTLMRMAVANIMDGYTAHYASLEMSKIEVQMRIHNMLSGAIGREVFNSMNLYLGREVNLPEYKKFLRSLKANLPGELTISDTRNIGVIEIAAHIERYHPNVYYLDFLTLAKMKRDGDWKDIGDFTKSLKDLAGDTHTTIVAAAQLNRNATQSKDVSGTENLSGSDQIGQDADGVITLRTRSTNVTEFKAAKFRQVPAGFKWFAQMDTSRGIFTEVSKNDAETIMERDRELADLAAVKAGR